MIAIERFKQPVLEPFAWCAKQFGPINPKDTRWYYDISVFWFRDQEDAVMFVLRWS